MSHFSPFLQYAYNLPKDDQYGWLGRIIEVLQKSRKFKIVPTVPRSVPVDQIPETLVEISIDTGKSSIGTRVRNSAVLARIVGIGA